MSSFEHLPLQIGDKLVLLQDMEFIDEEDETFMVAKGTVLEVESMDYNRAYYRDFAYYAESGDLEIVVRHTDYGKKYVKHNDQ
ncbi:hypothetical protein HP567_012975 [Brevibacillus sp. M2.1A]|uniref:hypothetical protein n=1 Tax=Brevibacillus sp. M2.1A TaxID=2738980 RepID=UPI00156BAACB|nr:hypothetical protein [Brevibacillus sp. M2.1A]MCC8435458.1 hypothetical protein [Brevibacillus sp. M2.1A]